VPDKNLLLDGAEHDEDEAQCGELGEDSESYAESPRKFGRAEKDGDAFWHADAFGASRGIFEVTVAAGDEDQSYHEAQEQDAEVGEAGELREHELSSRNIFLTESDDITPALNRTIFGGWPYD
jgi:hypothetical protein